MFPLQSRILVIDDTDDMRFSLIQELRILGFEDVLEARNGKEGLLALEAARREGSPVSIVFCDWQMPEMDGMGFLQAIRSRPEHQGLPVILVTAKSEFGDLAEGIEAGASQYLIKPANVEDLQEVLAAEWKNKFPSQA